MDDHRELLQELIRQTGPAPAEDVAAEDVLAAARAMIERRTPAIEALALLGPIQDASRFEAEREALRRAEEEWAKAILRARNDISHRLDSLRRVPHQRPLVRKSIGARRRA